MGQARRTVLADRHGLPMARQAIGRVALSDPMRNRRWCTIVCAALASTCQRELPFRYRGLPRLERGRRGLGQRIERTLIHMSIHTAPHRT
jgi:hypothetical protein